MQVLKGEGLTDFEYLALTNPGTTWDGHAAGFETVTFSVAPDTETDDIWGLYGVDYYDSIFVDKKGRLVKKVEKFTEDDIDGMNQRIRELHAE